MIDSLIIFLLKYGYLISAALLIIKIFIFIKHKNKTWTFGQFLFFDQLNIKLTSTVERARLKRVQNLLSILILTFLLLQVSLIIALLK